MEKLSKVILVIVILIALVYTSFFHSLNIYKEFEGISYRLGEKNTDVEAASIIIDGKVNNRPFKFYSFIGDLYVDNIKYDFSYKSWKSSQIVNIDENGESEVVGEAYFDKDFKEVTVRMFENGHWSSEDGLMITCPSKTKENALKRTNRLMKDDLDEFGLKELK